MILTTSTALEERLMWLFEMVLHDVDNHIVGSPDYLKILTFQPLHRSDSLTAYP